MKPLTSRGDYLHKHPVEGRANIVSRCILLFHNLFFPEVLLLRNYPFVLKVPLNSDQPANQPLASLLALSAVSTYVARCVAWRCVEKQKYVFTSALVKAR